MLAINRATGELCVADSTSPSLALLDDTRNVRWALTPAALAVTNVSSISDVTFDPASGSLYGSDPVSGRVFVVNSAGTQVSVLGLQLPSGASLTYPTAVQWMNGTLYVLDMPAELPGVATGYGSWVTRFDISTGAALAFWYGLHGPFQPEDDWTMTVDAAGNVFLSDDGDDGHGRVVQLSPNGTALQSFVITDELPQRMPQGLAFDATTCTLWMTDEWDRGVAHIAPDGTLLDFFPSPNGELFYSLVVDSTTQTLVLLANNGVYRMTSNGSLSVIDTSQAALSAQLGAVVVDAAGALYVSDVANSNIVKLSGEGELDASFSTVAAGFSAPVV